MITTACIFCFLGFWCWYLTSRRANYQSKNPIEIWLRNQPGNSKLLGAVSMSASFIVFTIHLGFAAGVFGFFMGLISFGSLIVILAPLRFLNYKLVGLIVLIAIFFETFPL